jgi:MYXO-CTERM domain-containing protein
MGDTGHMAITLVFMLVDSDVYVHGAVQVWKGVGIDLIAPAAPTDVAVASGDGHLHVSWTEPADTDLFDYGVFCDGPGDDRVCALPEAGARNAGLCATALAGTSTVVTGPLTDDVTHRISVVARDTVGNRSDASLTACAAPIAVKHTTKIIGGCGCDVSPAPTSRGIVLVAAAALLARHRRAARVRSNSK